MSLDLKTLVGTLERSSRGALERAAQRCLQLTHFEVEIEHLLLELIDIEGGDLACVLPHFALERDALIAEINRALEKFKRGNTRTPSFSRNLVMLHAGCACSVHRRAAGAAGQFGHPAAGVARKRCDVRAVVGQRAVDPARLARRVAHESESVARSVERTRCGAVRRSHRRAV